MNRFKLGFDLLAHRISALSGDRSSTFIRDFDHHVLHELHASADYKLIEKIRSGLIRNNTPVADPDFGAGSNKPSENKTIGGITRTSSVRPHYGRMLYRLARFYQPAQIIELGTAAGISTLYLSSGWREAKVITIEGSRQLADIAGKNFSSMGLNNITILNNSFENALPGLINDLAARSLIFIDGNHTLEATLRYFSIFGSLKDKNPVFIFDDINWSPGMRTAWNEIRQKIHNGVIIDLFFMGIYFPDHNYPPQFIRMNY